MRYDEYEAKIIKKAKVRRFFWKARLPIILGTAFTFVSSGALVLTGAALTFAVVATAGGLIAVKGAPIDTKTVKGAYTYGEDYQYKSISVFSKVEYEFANSDSDEWTNQAPIRVGKYKMRSKSKNNFSSYYYGNVHHFEIVPLSINLMINEASLTYGELPTLNTEQLVYGDSISPDYTFTYSDKTKDIWQIKPQVDSIHVYSSSGEDVTDCYSFVSNPINVQIDKRSVTIASKDAEKTYDNDSLSCEEFAVVNGSLAPGDTIELKNYNSITNAGSALNKHEYIIRDSNGVDMTNHYDINIVSGSLTIHKMPITFSTPDHEYTYDGYDKKFDIDEVEYDSSYLANGQTAQFAYSDDDEFIDAGTYQNAFSAKIMDNGVDVTDNYDINFEYGVTTIDKRDITITTASDSKTYDGVAISNDSYEITEGSLADKDELSVEAEEFIDSGEYENVFTYSIIDKETLESAMSNYNINSEEGQIVISPVDITISITQNTVVYDGEEHTNEYTISEGELVDGDTIEVIANETEIDAGTYDNDDFKIVINDKNGEDNSENYNISYIGRESSLVIEKRPITIEALAKEKLYDDKSILKTETGDSFALVEGTLVDKDYVDFKYLNDATDVGIYPIESEISIYHQTGNTPSTSKDKKVTSNYEITYVNNNFTINQRNITIKTIDASHEYNRNPIIPNNLSIFSVTDDGDGLVPGHTIDQLDITCEGINVGSYDYTLDTSSLKITNAYNKDVTANYNVTFINEGQLTIDKRVIYVQMLDDSKVYDGKVFSSTKHNVSNILSGDYLTFNGLPEVKHVFDGYKIQNPSGENVYMSNGEDVTANYDVYYSFQGSIHIDPRPITISSTGLDTTFDGLPIEKYKSYDVTSGSLADGDSIVIDHMNSYDNTYVHADIIYNSFDFTIYNEESLDVTGDYDFVKDEGMIIIHPCPIIMRLYEQSYIYDGLSHDFTYTEDNVTKTSEKIYVSEGEIPDGVTLSAEISFTDMKDVGEYESSYTSYGYSTTSPYGIYPSDLAISVINGKQIISHRSITVQSLGGSKAYDGKPFGYGIDPEDLIWVSNGSLAPGQSLSTYYSPDIIDVGENQEHIISGLTIVDGDSNDVTNNYSITYIYGRVTIYEH